MTKERLDYLRKRLLDAFPNTDPAVIDKVLEEIADIPVASLDDLGVLRARLQESVRANVVVPVQREAERLRQENELTMKLLDAFDRARALGHGSEMTH